jgi:hypothetical protein
MFLSDTNQSLKITLEEAINVSSLHVNIDYADHTSRIPVAGNTSILISSTTGTTVLNAATSPNQRHIKNISIYNADDINHNLIISQVYSATEITRKRESLSSGQTLQYSAHKGWSLI